MNLKAINNAIAKLSDYYAGGTFILFQEGEHYYASGRYADRLADAGEKVGVKVAFFPAPALTIARIDSRDFEKVLTFLTEEWKAGKIVITDKHHEAM